MKFLAIGIVFFFAPVTAIPQDRILSKITFPSNGRPFYVSGSARVVAKRTLDFPPVDIECVSDVDPEYFNRESQASEVDDNKVRTLVLVEPNPPEGGNVTCTLLLNHGVGSDGQLRVSWPSL